MGKLQVEIAGTDYNCPARPGQFDRVVFTGTGAGRAAVIYDFKTNVPGPDESAAAFAARMVSAYAGQMRRYRAALAALTGLAPARIRTKLLLAATATVAEVACDSE